MKKLFILSWLLIPLVALWITTNYLIGLGRNPTWNASANQELVQQVDARSPAAEPLDYTDGPLVTLWFDDAWSTQYTPAYDEMAKRGLRGALAVPTRSVGSDNYMSWAQIKLMQHKGWEITSHSQSHECDMTKLTAPFAEKELGGAKKDLASHGLVADNYVPPCGAITPAVTATAKKYYSSSRSSVNGLNPLPVKNHYDLKAHTLLRDTTIEDVRAWIDEARGQDVWLILVFHQVDDGTSEFGMNQGMLSNTLNAVTASGMPVVLPNQVLQMKAAQ